MDATEGPRELGQEAYARIRTAIRDGSLAPGLRLTETDLAARFGVSRTPVRQAIARLEAEGLLTHEPRRGLAVTRPDHAQVIELYVMRELSEINIRLHGLLCLAARNRYLLRSLEQLSATMALLPSLLATGGRGPAAHAEHRALLGALQARDGAAAEEAARAHVRAAQRHRLAWLVNAVGVPVATPGVAD